MITILRGITKEVVIDTEGPVVIIGECINPTRRRKLVSTLQARDFSYMLELAKSQINTMADVLDVNVGYPGVDDEALLPEAVIALQDNFDIPLCLDSPNPKAIEAALRQAAPPTNAGAASLAARPAPLGPRSSDSGMATTITARAARPTRSQRRRVGSATGSPSAHELTACDGSKAVRRSLLRRSTLTMPFSIRTG